MAQARICQVTGMGKSDSERACFNKLRISLQRGVREAKIVWGPLIILIMQSN